MNIFFRVDSSSQIGLGHLIRCLVLAKQYKLDNVVFISQELPGNANYKIKDSGYQFISLINDSVETLIDIINNNMVDLLIIDHYEIDYQFEKYVKKATNVKILSFDDTYNSHYCDILLNHNIYANNDQYKDLVPSFCELWCGKKYVLIRDEFKQIKSNSPQNNSRPFTVFVSMGGVDTNNISLKILKILINYKNISVSLATTSSNNNIDILLKFSQQYPQININLDHPNIAQLMDNSDFAIITPSVTVYEVMYLNLPFVAIKTAVNQVYLHKYLQDNNYYSFDSFDQKKIISIIDKKIKK